MTYLQNFVFRVKKEISVRVFNMITKKTEVKTMVKHILCGCKCKLNRTACNSNQKWNNETADVSV